MADRHEVFQVSCPANTPSTTPLEVATAFPGGLVRLVTVRWPRGHSSLTGLQVACAHQPLIPFTTGAFILGDSEVREYEPKDPPQSGQWSVFVYNTDNRAHYWQVTYDVENVQGRAPRMQQPTGPLAVGDIYNALTEV